jgi:hypothetical protein
VVYDPSHPEETYRDIAVDLWALPFFVLILQLATLAASFVDFQRLEKS